ncbi:MAG: GNAT family protein [Coriobacteriia bacterium]|jgi:aminoglycoside 6'-N-acetyltransferase|nr:GNAT family protein [Coriobacteriia bacterium]
MSSGGHVTEGELTGHRVVLRPLVDDDLDVLSGLASGRGCQPWWTDPSVTGLRDSLLEATDTWSWTVVVDTQTAGVVSAYSVGWPPGSALGLAIMLGDAWQDRGLGPETLSVLIAHLIGTRGVRRFVVDPAAANLRAIRAYESLGFKRIGVARQSEPAPDGSWRDCLLMDLLATEFHGRL